MIIVDCRITHRRGWTGVNNSPLLPLVYDNRIVEPLIVEVGLG